MSPSYRLRSLILELIHSSLRAASLPPAELSDDFNFVESGVLDSISFLQLIADLEAHLQITLELYDVDPDRLTTLGGLIEILQSAQSNLPPLQNFQSR